MIDTWALAIGSYWAGSERGWLIDGPPFPVDGGGYPQVLFKEWGHESFSISPSRYINLVLTSWD